MEMWLEGKLSMSQPLQASISAKEEATMRRPHIKTLLVLRSKASHRWGTLSAQWQSHCWISQWWLALVSIQHVRVTQTFHLPPCRLTWPSIIDPVRNRLNRCQSDLVDFGLSGTFHISTERSIDWEDSFSFPSSAWPWGPSISNLQRTFLVDPGRKLYSWNKRTQYQDGSSRLPLRSKVSSFHSEVPMPQVRRSVFTGLSPVTN